MKRRAAAAGAILFCLIGFAPASSSEQTAWEQIWIPAQETAFLGRKEEIRLDAALYRPNKKGPLPLFIWNHGSTGRGAIPTKQNERYPAIGQLLANYGFAVIVPMRRGRGASGGYYGESEHTMCDYGQNAAGVERAMEDLDAVVAYAGQQPFVDGSKGIVMGGISRGGFLSLVYSASQPNLAIRKVVNFVGGWTNDGCAGFNAPMLQRAGQSLRAPTLWIYGERDSNYSNESIRSYVEHFQRAGGKAVPALSERFD